MANRSQGHTNGTLYRRAGRRLRQALCPVALLISGLLAGCGTSGLPGMAFPGGPSPWLPGGAPGSSGHNATPSASAPAVASAPAPGTADPGPETLH